MDDVRDEDVHGSSLGTEPVAMSTMVVPLPGRRRGAAAQGRPAAWSAVDEGIDPAFQPPTRSLVAASMVPVSSRSPPPLA